MIRTLVEIQGGRVSIRETGTGQTEVSVIVDGALSEVEGLGSRLYTAEKVGDLQASEAELVAAPLRRRIAELMGQVREYDRDRTTERDRADQNKAWAERAEAEVDRLKTGRREDHEEIEELRRQRDSALDDLEKVKTQRDDERERALQNKEWAERAELRLSKDTESYMRQIRELRDSLEARDRLLESATRDLNNVVRHRDELNAKVHGPNGLYAQLAESAKDRDRMAAQIGEVSGAVHSPEILLALQYDWGNWDEKQYGAVTQAIEDTRRAIGSPGPETSPA